MMKDKLYKYHHKAFYYIARKALFSVSIFIAVGIAVAVPTTINLLTTPPTKGLAEGQNEVEKTEEENNENIDINSLQQY